MIGTPQAKFVTKSVLIFFFKWVGGGEIGKVDEDGGGLLVKWELF